MSLTNAQTTEHSVARTDAIAQTDFFRCTVLTERLFRLEFSPDNCFEDRPSQVFWHRDQKVPPFDLWEDDKSLFIKTSFLELSCLKGSVEEINRSLIINGDALKSTWHTGDVDDLNLLGTARTLDESNGEIELEKGLLSRSGWSVVDDSKSLVFNEEGNLVPRAANQFYQDIYFFGHGHDYKQALKDFNLVSGKSPLIPRWALGNWWSRYWNYSDRELLRLMDDFSNHNVPLSVCVIDMDWHITDTGNQSSGWTGYTWNKDLFPTPGKLLDRLHEKGLKATLNLHPADGVHPHEGQYVAMCKAMGIDPDKKEPIPFDISDQRFTDAYFRILHHPLEKEGVDFWWIDWQQGSKSDKDGLDPLWWLNHFHYNDQKQRVSGLALILSRYGGLGSHRYPIGFSGDTIVSWDSLAFQPYFTATSANVNYGWWSHDIGGHMHGVVDSELYTRWVQFGVFSPIFRLHSGNEPFQERRPWGFNKEVEQIASEYMRLRHRMIPYLYSMTYRSHEEDLPLILPMYYEWPEEENAYRYQDQYLFGSELLIAPFLKPRDKKTKLCDKEIWLPVGTWFNFFNGATYSGDACVQVAGGLSEIPVFATEGAIIPLAGEDSMMCTGTPNTLELVIFPGGDNCFQLIEDDGMGNTSRLLITQSYSAKDWQIEIHPVVGYNVHLPEQRTFQLSLRGLEEEVSYSVFINDNLTGAETFYDKKNRTQIISGLVLSSDDRLVFRSEKKGEFDT